MTYQDGTPFILRAFRDNWMEFISTIIKKLRFFQHSNDEVSSETAMIWSLIISQTKDMFENEISDVLDKHAHKIHILLSIKDEHGRSVIDVATPKYKRAMMERMYFHRRYEFRAGPAVHVSATSVVKIAVDHMDNQRSVALKFIRFKEHFLREITVRENGNFDEAYVVRCVRSYDGDKDESFRLEALSKGFYPYCIVMPAAERTLRSVLFHEHIAGREWDMLRLIAKQLLVALGHMHDKGFIHGDLKPLNIMRVDGTYRLIDLDASVNLNTQKYISNKYSSGFVPPEMIAKLYGKYQVRTYALEESSGLPLTTDLPYTLLAPDSSFDMWSVGVTLYFIFAGETLFNTNVEGNVDEKQLRKLYHWTDEFKNERLERISDRAARNLISRLLTKDPLRRPDVQHALAHPFFHGLNSVRLLGEEASYDVFLSYRVSSDVHHAEYLYERLTASGLRVWWDKMSLKPGVPWEEGFCDGLVNSKAFVPLLSRKAINNPTDDKCCFSQLTEDSHADNVLLEYRLALELRNLGLLDIIYPIMIGDSTVHSMVGIAKGFYSNYFKSGCHPIVPDVSVRSVENKLREHLDRMGLGAPITSQITVKEILSTLTSFQGGLVEGSGKSGFEKVCETIKGMISVLKDVSMDNGGRMSTPSARDPPRGSGREAVLSMKDNQLDRLIRENRMLRESLGQLASLLQEIRPDSHNAVLITLVCIIII